MSLYKNFPFYERSEWIPSNIRNKFYSTYWPAKVQPSRIDVQSTVDGAEIVEAPDFPVELAVAAAPVLLPLIKSQHFGSLRHDIEGLLTFQTHY